MGKGLLILLAVFAVVAMLNFSSVKLMKLEAVKKTKYKKLFWYFYGVFFIFSGVVNCIEKSEMSIVFISNTIIGVVVLVLNYLGKFETKEVA